MDKMAGRASYLIRVDDACPTMDHTRWNALEHILDRHDVKPIVAVVPDNKDPLLLRAAPDEMFWQRVKSWQARGWLIGLHGYQHIANFQNRGLLRLHTKSEFAGGTLEEQRNVLRAGMNSFRKHGIEPDLFVAPFHTFDRTTLRALKLETSLAVISDGLAYFPYQEFGIFWLPQQLWAPQEKGRGVWTICLHPNTMDDGALAAIEKFLGRNAEACQIDLTTLMRAFGHRRRTTVDRVLHLRIFLHRELAHYLLYRVILQLLARLKREISHINAFKKT